MKISIIVAVAENNVIGKDNRLIWRMPEDMKFFKEKTEGHCVVTGRKNYESIPEKFRPLPLRTNIVVTRQENYTAPGSIVVGSIYEAVETAREINEKELFIIGGADIYKQCIDLADCIYITRIHNDFEGDAFFPNVNLNNWKLTDRKVCKADDKNAHDYTFETYIRN